MVRRLTRLVFGLMGAELGALLVALIEAYEVTRASEEPHAGSFARLVAAELGVLAALAFGVGLVVSLASVFFEPDRPLAPVERVAALRREPILARSRSAALAPLVCLAAAAWLVCTAQLARSAMQEGAPLATGVALAVKSSACLIGLAVMVTAVLAPVRRLLARAASNWPPAIDPALTGAVGIAVLVAVIGVGAYQGDTAGQGSSPLAIFGVLKRHELDLRPIVNLTVIAACAWVIQLASAARPRRWDEVLAALVIVGAALGMTIHEANALEREPEAALAIERHGALGRLALALDRKATDRDRDGASPYFGGGDCDDRNPKISPFAVEIPGNGIDEDCSGADLPIVDAHRSAMRATSDERSSAFESPPVAGAAASVRPAGPIAANLILITIDALRASELGFLGYDKPTTPNLDALASDSVVFDRAYALASYTGKALGPMLIGKYPSETVRDGAHFNRYSARNTFVAERLRDAGIFTMGAAAHWYFQDSFGLNQGFNIFDHSAIPAGGQGDSDTTVTSQQLTDVALKLLALRAASGRFFLWLHYFDPHAQYVAHPEAPDFNDPGNPSAGRMRALYDGEVWFTDHSLGRLLDYIKTQSWSSDTAIVLTSDHGESMNDHGMGYQHGFEIWEPLVRIPLLFHVPGMPSHHVPVKRGVIDLVPTLLDLMGVPQPEAGELSGQSLMADLAAAAPGSFEERDVYLDMPEGPFTHMRRGIIHGETPGLKLVHLGGKQYQLYDLQRDPDEAHDLASDTSLLAPMLEAFQAKRATLHEIYVAPDSTPQ